MGNFKELSVWKKSMDIISEIYIELQNFPKDETFWLSSQIKRSAISIPSNIAEWSDRKSDWDFRRFLLIAKWSSSELETQLIIAKNLWYITEEKLEYLSQKIEEIRKMLSWLISKL